MIFIEIQTDNITQHINRYEQIPIMKKNSIKNIVGKYIANNQIIFVEQKNIELII